MHENVFAARSLDESITLGGVKPFHNTLFSHYFGISCISFPVEPGHRSEPCHCRTQSTQLQEDISPGPSLPPLREALLSPWLQASVSLSSPPWSIPLFAPMY